MRADDRTQPWPAVRMDNAQRKLGTAAAQALAGDARHVKGRTTAVAIARTLLMPAPDGFPLGTFLDRLSARGPEGEPGRLAAREAGAEGPPITAAEAMTMAEAYVWSVPEAVLAAARGGPQEGGGAANGRVREEL